VLKVAVIPEQGSSGPVTERQEMLGGKGANQAVGMARLGMQVSLIAAVGDDEIGARLIEQADADANDTSYIAQRAQMSTALIVSIVEEGGWRYLEHIPPAALVTPGDIKRAASAFHGAGTVVIQLQQPPTALAAAKLGRQCRCRVVLDGAPAEEYREPLLAISDVVRADAREAELLTGCSIRSGDDAIAAGREIL
jgi:ribokinase